MDTPASPEALLISAVIQTGDHVTPGEAGLTPEFFHSYRTEWEWIEKFITRYRKTPDKATFRAQFPDFRLFKTTDVDHECDAVRKGHLRHALTKSVQEATRYLVADRPEDALDSIRSQIMGVSQDAGTVVKNVITDYSLVFKEAARRVEAASANGLAGIDTGYVTLNERTGGLQPGNLWIMAARLGAGKALVNGTGVLTPRGYVPIEELQVGSRVIGSDGKPTKVIGVYPQGEKQVFDVEFSDGSVIEACEEHLWNTRVGTKSWKVQTTGQIAKRLESNQQRVVVPALEGPVEFVESGYLYDPYRLGLLLGDGCFRGKEITFSTADPELLVGFGRNAVHRNRYDYAILRTVPTIKALGLYGKYSHEKHIPSEYLFSSPTDRLALLQGLFDTDATVTQSGGVEFSTSSLRLSEDVRAMVESLGGYATVRLKKTTHRDHYRMTVVLPAQMCPFRLERKKALWKPRSKYQPVRAIVAVRSTDRYEPMTCIAVEATDSLFATEHAILTHNTWNLANMATTALMAGKKVAFVTLEMPTSEIVFRIHTFLARKFGYSIRNSDLMYGRSLDLHEYKGFLSALPDKVPGELGVYDPTRGQVSPYTLATIIESSQPDVVFVDYITLMKRQSDEWQGVAQLSRECKEVALRFGTPIVCAAQINRLGEGGQRPPGVDKLSQGDSIGQDADVVVTGRKYSNVARQWLLAKNRQGPDDIVYYSAFDPDHGNMDEITYDEALRRSAEASIEDE